MKQKMFNIIDHFTIGGNLYLYDGESENDLEGYLEELFLENDIDQYRILFFNNSIYISWIENGELEVWVEECYDWE